MSCKIHIKASSLQKPESPSANTFKSRTAVGDFVQTGGTNQRDVPQLVSVPAHTLPPPFRRFEGALIHSFLQRSQTTHPNPRRALGSTETRMLPHSLAGHWEAQGCWGTARCGGQPWPCHASHRPGVQLETERLQHHLTSPGRVAGDGRGLQPPTLMHLMKGFRQEPAGVRHGYGPAELSSLWMVGSCFQDS